MRDNLNPLKGPHNHAPRAILNKEKALGTRLPHYLVPRPRDECRGKRIHAVQGKCFASKGAKKEGLIGYGRTNTFYKPGELLNAHLTDLRNHSLTTAEPTNTNILLGFSSETFFGFRKIFCSNILYPDTGAS